jgi:hypothetical protein
VFINGRKHYKILKGKINGKTIKINFLGNKLFRKKFKQKQLK